MQEFDAGFNNLHADIEEVLFLTFAKRLMLNHNQIYGTLPLLGTYIAGYVSPTLRWLCLSTFQC